MDGIAELLRHWEESRCDNISVGGLISRNKVAHKWKSPYRSFVLRECVFWRVQDLLVQAHALFGAKHILGSRILIRSAIETVALLVYLNQIMERVISGELNFNEFSEITSTLLLGSRDGTTRINSINILTILKHCHKKYPGIEKVYGTLSESAHPNWEGICYGYSRIDHENYESNFSNNWIEMWRDDHEPLMLLVIQIFESEYNDVWPALMERPECWIEANDATLEATKIGS